MKPLWDKKKIECLFTEDKKAPITDLVLIMDYFLGVGVWYIYNVIVNFVLSIEDEEIEEEKNCFDVY